MITISDEHKISKKCFICCNIETNNLPCKCIICEDCLFQWIATKNYEILFTTLKIFSCPNHNCKKEISLLWLQDNLSKKNLNCINEILLKKLLNTCQDIRKCPNGFCTNSGWIDISNKCSDLLQCDMCEIKWLDPSLMKYELFHRIYIYFSNFKENILSDSTELNILLTSKPCPSCGIKIYKYMGCDHVTCSSCNTQFCYNCVYIHTSANSLLKVYCEYKCLISGVSVSMLVFACVLKLFSSFYYLRTITFWILYYFGVNILAGIWISLLSFFGYMALYNVFNRDYYNRSPHIILKFTCFILFAILVAWSIYCYKTNDGAYRNTNIILYEILVGGVGILGAYIFKPDFFQIGH